MSDGDLYEKKNCVSLKDCEKAGRIKDYNIAVSWYANFVFQSP